MTKSDKCLVKNGTTEECSVNKGNRATGNLWNAWYNENHIYHWLNIWKVKLQLSTELTIPPHPHPQTHTFYMLFLRLHMSKEIG